MMQVELPTAASLIVSGGVGAVVVLQGMILAKLNKIDPLGEKVQKHEQTLYGVNGNNGLNGDVKKLKVRSSIQREIIQRHSQLLETPNR